MRVTFSILKKIEKEHGGSRYFFEHADIADTEAVNAIFEKHDIDAVC